ncbi:hypothetical protein AsAng_0005230 [Aureispira anguillae]|uniref:Uncharacterized protein n=1 Tax=Aureispira anguillae TaxID=2864201 RepID=A0A915YB38_9BACT|nr:hypothetical protein AsAng_0005230 [Aureispira anguillae]
MYFSGFYKKEYTFSKCCANNTLFEFKKFPHTPHFSLTMKNL